MLGGPDPTPGDQGVQAPQSRTRRPRRNPLEDPRWAAFAEILALEAHADPFVGNWRARHLPPRGLLSRDAAPAFRDQLDPNARGWLEQIAASLVDRHGWWDAGQAALCVLTGAAPHGLRIRTHITVRDRVEASRVMIEADPRASPQAVADSYRHVREGRVGLRDRPLSGRPRLIDDEQIQRLLAKTLERPTDGSSHWSARCTSSSTTPPPTRPPR